MVVNIRRPVCPTCRIPIYADRDGVFYECPNCNCKILKLPCQKPIEYNPPAYYDETWP